MVKSLTQEELRVISYVKREKDRPEFDPKLQPVSFMITQFHIIFVYPTNLTVLSSITQEIVYSRNFDAIKIRSSVFDLYQRHVLIVGQKDQIEYSKLENEGRDAWKQYLKRGHIRQALDNCQSSQKPYVAGIYADQLFMKKEYS